jgi:hypothetical protein
LIFFRIRYQKYYKYFYSYFITTTNV